MVSESIGNPVYGVFWREGKEGEKEGMDGGKGVYVCVCGRGMREERLSLPQIRP